MSDSTSLESAPPTEPAPTQKYRDRIVQRFDAQSKRFNLIFVLVLSFGLVFFSFILLPYFSLAFDEHEIGMEIAELKKESQQLDEVLGSMETNLDALKTKEQGLSSSLINAEKERKNINKELKDIVSRMGEFQVQLKDKIADLDETKTIAEKFQASHSAIDDILQGSDYNVAELRLFLGELLRSWETGQLQPDSQCPVPDRTEQVRCRVRGKVQRQFESYGSRLRQNVITRLQAVNPEAADKLLGMLDRLMATLTDSLVENPDFWRTISDKELFYSDFENRFGDLANNVRIILTKEAKVLAGKIAAADLELGKLREQRMEVEKTIARLGKRKVHNEGEIVRIADDIVNGEKEIKQKSTEINSLTSVIEKTKESNDTKKNSLEEQRVKIEKDREKIAQRLNTIQSPVGALPIGLEESILAFPVILAIGFWIYAAALSELIKLRQVLHRHARESGDIDPYAEEDGIMLIAPLWFDPMASLPSKCLRGFALLVPILVFGLAVYLIWYSWELSDQTGAAADLEHNLYIFAYITSLVFSAIGVWQIRASFFTYSVEDGTSQSR